MVNKIKNLGQIYTPHNIVVEILNLVNYNNTEILQKHIIDNSCGNGAFLCEILKRYIYEYQSYYNTLNGIELELENFIHGIEIDKTAFNECINNLNKIIFSHGINKVNWNIINKDALKIKTYNHKMDFVVGNPPYVRIHNIKDDKNVIHKFKFSNFGMTDLYIIFYEIGFNMLNKTGKLCYITPNSFYTSIAGNNFRKFLFDTKHLYSIIDLGHYQPFKTNTYTTICAFDFERIYKAFDYSKYNNLGAIEFQDKLELKDSFNNDSFILAKKINQKKLKNIQNVNIANNDILVKNGFATLSDKTFIQSKFDFEDNIIDIIKASTGEWKKCLFPYDNQGNLIDFENLNVSIKNYFLKNKKTLVNRSIDKKTEWYAFGRSQALLDVKLNKYSINTTIKDISSIKLNFVPAGAGIYSGLYIITKLSEKELRNIIFTNEFIEYIQILGKFKSGGYYTYTSNDLKKFLYYKIKQIEENYE